MNQRSVGLGLAFFVLSGLGLQTAVVAQGRPGRAVGSHSNNHPADEVSRIRVGEAGQVSIVSRVASRPVRWVFQTGVTAVGSYCLVGPDISDGVIVSGRCDRGGVLEHWLLSEDGQWECASRFEDSEADFAGVAVGGQWIYVLDCKSQSIRRAKWLGSGGLSRVQLVDCWTAGDMPVLAQATSLFLRWIPDGQLPDVDGDALLLIRWWEQDHPVYCHLINLKLPSQYARSYVLGGDGDAGAGFVVADRKAVVGGSFTMAVVASSGLRFEVVEEAGVVIGGGVGRGDGRSQEVQLSRKLELGRFYHVRETGADSGDRFQCVRMGASMELPDGAIVVAVDMRMRHIGHDQDLTEGSFLLRLKLGIGQAIGRDYVGCVLLGVGGGDCAPSRIGQDWGLGMEPLGYVVVIGGVSGVTSVGSLGASWRVPVSLELHGRHLLGQCLIPCRGYLWRSEIVLSTLVSEN